MPVSIPGGSGPEVDRNGSLQWSVAVGVIERAGWHGRGSPSGGLTIVSDPRPDPGYVCLVRTSKQRGMGQGPITTIGELVRELLRHRDQDGFGGILARYAVESRDLEPYFRWNTRHYTRTCIHRNEDFELLVICYEPGQRTSIHDFDSQTAWIHPVLGEVYEERFALTKEGRPELLRSTLLRSGSVDSLSNGNSIHRFTNRGPDRAVTLNLYAKPLRKWRVFDEGTGATTVLPAGPPP